MLHLDQKPWCPVVVWIFWNDLNNIGGSVWDLLIDVIVENLSSTVWFFCNWKLCTFFRTTVFSNLLQCCVSYSRPPWFDLPPPPYCSESEVPSQPDLPPYRSRTGSLVSTDTPMAGSPLGSTGSWTRDIHDSVDGHRTLVERTADQSNSLVNHVAEREV